MGYGKRTDFNLDRLLCQRKVDVLRSSAHSSTTLATMQMKQTNVLSLKKTWKLISSTFSALLLNHSERNKGENE